MATNLGANFAHDSSAATWETNCRKTVVPFTKNVSLDAYRNNLKLMDFPAALSGVYSLPKDTVVELANGARALIGKNGHLACLCNDNILFVMNKDGTRVGLLNLDDPNLCHKFSITGEEGSKFAQFTGLAKTAKKAESSTFTWTKEGKSNETFEFLQPGKSIKWKAAFDKQSPIRSTTAHHLHQVSDDLLDSAWRLMT
jgi:hypothetical protein